MPRVNPRRLNALLVSALLVCSALTGVGLYWLGGLAPGTSPFIAFAAATVFGVGKTYFWPTMLGVTAEQFPRGGALLISLMGGTGMLSVAVALPIMGAEIDRFGPGADVKLGIDVADVRVNGLKRDRERIGYFLVHVTFGQQPEDFPFARR